MLPRQRHYSVDNADPSEEFAAFPPSYWQNNHPVRFQTSGDRHRSNMSASTRRRRLLPACPQPGQPAIWTSVDYDDRALVDDYDQPRRQASVPGPPRQRRGSLYGSGGASPIFSNSGIERSPGRRVMNEAQRRLERQLSMVEQQQQQHGLSRKFSERQLPPRNHSTSGEHRLMRKYSESVYMSPRCAWIVSLVLLAREAAGLLWVYAAPRKPLVLLRANRIVENPLVRPRFLLWLPC